MLSTRPPEMSMSHDILSQYCHLESSLPVLSAFQVLLNSHAICRATAQQKSGTCCRKLLVIAITFRYFSKIWRERKFVFMFLQAWEHTRTISQLQGMHNLSYKKVLLTINYENNWRQKLQQYILFNQSFKIKLMSLKTVNFLQFNYKIYFLPLTVTIAYLCTKLPASCITNVCT